MAVSLAVAASVSLSACSDGKNDEKTPAPKTSTSAAPSPQTAAPDPAELERKEVLTAYERMWEEQVEAYRKADPSGTQLQKYTGALAWSSAKNDLKDLKSKGIVATGSPTHDVEVTAIDTNAKVPTAQLTDCLDTSSWKLVYDATDKPVEMPQGRLTRYSNKIEAERWGDQWKILNVVPQREAC
jgi:hypothetical protein